jgi:hypothetical protein
MHHRKAEKPTSDALIGARIAMNIAKLPELLGEQIALLGFAL